MKCKFIKEELLTTIADLPTNERGCKLWPGRHLSGGYPSVIVDGVHTRISRYLLSLNLDRPMRRDLHACHDCDTPLCVNVEHLYEGTRSQNMSDCVRRGRHKHSLPDQVGELHSQSRLTERDVIAIRSLSSRRINHKKIADFFGIADRHCRAIISGDKWGHVT